jgi:IS30 family transposase
MTVEQERVYAETIRVRYHDLGYTQDEIAAEDHRSHYTISELMKRHRIPTRRGYPARAIAAASRLPDPEDALITPALRELGR